jgi:hypothetical protein
VTAPKLDAREAAPVEAARAPAPRSSDVAGSPGLEPRAVPEPEREVQPQPEPRVRVRRATVASERDARAAIEPSEPVAELALLKAARARARSEPARALELCVEHEQRFARGAFVQEREVIAIEALLASGRRGEAEQRAARFLERFAESAHARRVRALLVEAGAVDRGTKPSGVAHPAGQDPR